jgi:hypothetical protein
MKSAFAPHKISGFQALHDWVVVRDMQFDERITTSGIILLNDNGKGNGIRPRWAQIYAVGPEQTAVEPGQWICVAHGRWTRGVKVQDHQGETTLRKIDPKDILLVSDEQPDDDTMSDALHVEQRSR